MKANNAKFKLSGFLLLIVMVFGVIPSTKASSVWFQEKAQNQQTYVTYKGEVINQQTQDPITAAHLSVNNTNIATITNTQGEFSLKVPKDMTNATVTTSVIGYESKTVHLEYFNAQNTQIQLNESSEKLSEVNIFSATDAEKLIQKVLKNRGENYVNDPALMTGFYRETIQKRNRNVSLSEAVVKIHKQAYDSERKDKIALFKARKSTDYKRLDTLALKLRGGPFNSLYADLMKYPEFLFRNNIDNSYKFSFDDPTTINNRYIYVVKFEDTQQDTPWYYGKLYIDAKTLSLVKADYSLNVNNRRAAMNMFVWKKPGRVKVFPVNVNYQITYIQNNEKWYYGYGNAQLEFVVNWKHKLFNSRYTLNSEMIVTDWEKQSSQEKQEKNRFIKPSIVMVDDVSGFIDTNFWGQNNIIEPEKSIQEAYEKIRQRLKKSNP